MTITDTAELPRIIGISGYSGAGKTAVGYMIAEETRLPVVHMADPLKRIIRELDPFDQHGVLLSTYLEIGGEAKAKADHDKYRHALRTIGEGVRDILPAFWLRALAKECVGMHSVIVPDIRHPEDADACAVLLNVTRPGVNSDGHSTERDMSALASHHLYNNGDLATLAAKVHAFVNDLEISPNEY